MLTSHCKPSIYAPSVSLRILVSSGCVFDSLFAVSRVLPELRSITVRKLVASYFHMAKRFQATTLLGSPLYPNAIAWSDENLIAVASGHIVTILNPDLPNGPRGLITIPTSGPLPVGVIQREDLLTGCMLPISLRRDRKPCVRSVSWSPLGISPNSGCLLAVCTSEGRVKVYRPPFSDFTPEWIEVIDMMEMLCRNLLDSGYLHSDIYSSSDCCQPTENSVDSDLPCTASRKRARTDVSRAFGDKLLFQAKSDINIGRILEGGAISKCNSKSQKRTSEDCTLQLITAHQYASRNAMLCSTAIAWSPVLHARDEQCNFLQGACLLAVGAKSGVISLWKFNVYEHPTIEHGDTPTTVSFLGLFQAHHSWVTAISWSLVASDSSKTQILLATGSSDGSTQWRTSELAPAVRIWSADNEKLVQSSDVKDPFFSLVKEVITVDAVPVSVVSAIIPSHSSCKILLAVGKGSGALEIWSCELSSKIFEKLHSYNGKNHVITGLAWAFDGSCLYSCSQDNFVRSWILSRGSLCEVPIAFNKPGSRSISRHPANIYGSCFGVAISPGNLVLATVHCFDVDKLDRMYEVRTYKAAVEFFWIGGQKVDIRSTTSFPFDVRGICGSSDKELAYWGSNILWSLKQFENLSRPVVVVWDILAALLAFKQYDSEYVEQILLKWLSVAFIGSRPGLSDKEVLSHVSTSLSDSPSRLLHLLNIICRRVMLSGLEPDQINQRKNEVEKLEDLLLNEEKKSTHWLELLFNSERELRERLVGFSFSAFLGLKSHADTNLCQLGRWYPAGITQMEHWVALNHNLVRNQLKVLALQIRSHKKSDNLATDQCGYCSAPVPFESPEFGLCLHKDFKVTSQRHKSPRCAVSMQVCGTTPSWFCICCHRLASKLAPNELFIMSAYPEDFSSLLKSPLPLESSKPVCPFCGILLQRRQPDFLLSPSPV